MSNEMPDPDTSTPKDDLNNSESKRDSKRPAKKGNKTPARHDGSMRRIAIVVGVVVLIVFFLIGIVPRLRRNGKLADEAKAATAAQPQVPVQRPEPSPGADISLPGTTEAITDAVISARSSGYLSKRFVDIGDRVERGQTLALIESPDVDQQLYQAQAQAAQSRAQTQQAVADLANKRATVSQFRSNVRQAEANVEQTNAQLSDAEAKLAQLIAAKGAAEAQADQAEHQVGIKQAVVTQAETQRHLTELTFKRYKTLLESGYVALQDEDQAEAAYKTAAAAVVSAEADLSASKSAARAAAQQVQSADANIRSGEAEVLAAKRSIRAVEATVHSSESTVVAAQANVRLGQSNVAANLDAEHANQFNAKRFAVLTSFEKVVAPFAGVITARNVEVGTLVNAGQSAGGGSSGSGGSAGSAVNIGSASSGSASPSTASAGGLFGLARIDTIRILLTVPQAYVKMIRPGQTAHVVIREFPGKIFTGSVARMAGALDTNSRTLLTEVHIDNRNGAILPGMYTQIHFDVANPTGQFRVPSSVIISDALGTRVAVVGNDNKVHFTVVHISRDYGQHVDINEGLNGGENIIVSPTDDLIEGEVVRPTVIPVTDPNGPRPGASSGKPIGGPGATPTK